MRPAQSARHSAGTIARQVSVTGAIRLTPGRAKLVALAGPAGSGKTTTAAKLAVHFTLYEGKRVALVQIGRGLFRGDGFLRRCGEAIGVPTHVVKSAAGLRSAAEALRGYDLVLVDTSRPDWTCSHQGDLRNALDHIAGSEMHLILAAGSAPERRRREDTAAMIYGADALAVTHVDLATHDMLLASLAAYPLPLSYLGSGPLVTDGLEAASSAALNRRLPTVQAW